MPPSLLLLPIDSELATAVDAGPAGVLLRYRARLGADADAVREVVQRTLALRPPAPWGGYLAVDERSRDVVGTCAFRGPPSAEGAVEIVLLTFSAHQGRGYATAMATRLLELAWSAPGVARVVAHTPPERGASTRILEKLGLQRAGTVDHPEDGPVWRWERPRPGWATARPMPVPPT